MEQAVRELLESVDDPIHGECPPEFDSATTYERAKSLQPILEQIAGRSFVFDDGVQDASFFADLSIHRPGPKAGWIDTVFAVRFSNFGNLFTTWAHGPEQLPEATVAELIAAVERAGFRFVPESALAEVYSGRHPGLVGINWWIRYFDYL